MARSLHNLLTIMLANHPTIAEKSYPAKKNPLHLHHQLRFPASFNRHFSRTPTMSLNSVNQPQKMVVVNDQSEKLVGLLHDTGSKDVVVVCHGFKSSKEQETMVDICGALEKEGISAYRFDFSGNGDSDGAFAYGNYVKEAEDIRAVVKHFHGANRIVSAILGHSKGGNVVLLYASKYHDVRTVVNLSGRYDLKKGIAERLGEDFMERIEKKGFIDVECKKTGKFLFRVTKENTMDRLNTDMQEAALRIDKNCRVLTVHGSADKTTPVEDAYEFSKIIPNHKLHIIEGANHPFSEHQDELIPVIADFIKSCIQQDKEISG
ncbi:uncharacterized protein LOC110683064 [Chenopodium quinoa]|uniref:uncharacterized protein LOC110683064 n=1 Tax=Chenopodium quinoa TaxID=63459 RepID=UPI000B78E3F7|nr:uncharacterized protein LOC110683064 [Chenopodium quinoa]